MYACLRLALIAALLLCPFDCMGVFAGTGASTSDSLETKPAPRCGCCVHQAPVLPIDDDRSLPTPVPGPEDGSCDGCVCHGALGSADELDVVFGTLTGPISIWACLPPASVDAARADRHVHRDAPPPPAGREARVLRRSFQV